MKNVGKMLKEKNHKNIGINTRRIWNGRNRRNHRGMNFANELLRLQQAEERWNP